MTKALEQASATGKRHPDQHPIKKIASHKYRCRSRNPEAQAVEAVHELADDAFTQPCANSRNQICRAVFARQQVRQTPRSQDSQDKAEPNWHGNHRRACNQESGTEEAELIFSAPSEPLSPLAL